MTPQYEQNSFWFQVSISCWRLETISINVHENTSGMLWIYSGSRRQPPRYHDQLTLSSLCQCIAFCFTKATTPVSRPRPKSSCYKTANRTPRNTTTIFYRYPYVGKLVTCQQHYVVLILKHRGYRDAGVSASAVNANVTWTNLYCKLFWNLYCRYRLFLLCGFIVQ